MIMFCVFDKNGVFLPKIIIINPRIAPCLIKMHLTFIRNLLNHACTNVNKLSTAFLYSTISNVKLAEAILPDLRLDISNNFNFKVGLVWTDF